MLRAMPGPRHVILQTGSTLPAVRARRGDVPGWFVEKSGLDAGAFHVVDAPAGDALPPPEDVGAVIVTGSAAMVTDRAAWSEAAGRWLAERVQEGTPVLGVCYGHQLLADAMGGVVGDNPNGREIGTIRVALGTAAADDPLFAGLPNELTVQATHSQSVLALPPGAVRLAANDKDGNQAYRLGERAWGVQFHPEYDADIVRGYIEGRRQQLVAEGMDPDALLRAAADTDHGTRILRRFLDLAR